MVALLITHMSTQNIHYTCSLILRSSLIIVRHFHRKTITNKTKCLPFHCIQRLLCNLSQNAFQNQTAASNWLLLNHRFNQNFPVHVSIITHNTINLKAINLIAWIQNFFNQASDVAYSITAEKKYSQIRSQDGKPSHRLSPVRRCTIFLNSSICVTANFICLKRFCAGWHQPHNDNTRPHFYSVQ